MNESDSSKEITLIAAASENNALGKDKGQISNVCSALSDDGKIIRANRASPWNLVEKDF